MKQQDDPGFQRLWQLWRKHARKTDGPGKARPTYLKWIAEGASPEDIFDGAAYHLRTMLEKDKPYIQLLSVYINGERWMDECEEERTFQARIQASKERADNTVVQMRDHARREIEVTPEARQMVEQLKARHAPNR